MSTSISSFVFNRAPRENTYRGPVAFTKHREIGANSLQHPSGPACILAISASQVPGTVGCLMAGQAGGLLLQQQAYGWKLSFPLGACTANETTSRSVSGQQQPVNWRWLSQQSFTLEVWDIKASSVQTIETMPHPRKQKSQYELRVKLSRSVYEEASNLLLS